MMVVEVVREQLRPNPEVRVAPPALPDGLRQRETDGGEFGEKLSKFLQFGDGRIHETPEELISEALSAKLRWLSRIFRGMNL